MMSKGVFEIKVKELNLEVLGAMMLKVAPISKQLNHKWPKSTMEAYIDPDSAGEAEFIRDLFQLTTDEIVEKWYGGMDGAAKFIHHV
ncbi:hypothetical protein CHH67_18830 [Paenibacillus campinasensis]|uniref:Uncharacterized protein n=2 Tax=Paenibacillus campinasensis TaxID=66347 RepID=A0A268EL94_9BACL|nr:hypothetical protein CHH67_18830 [Paenibacillus campinasensis]